jgi:hypothetical protein
MTTQEIYIALHAHQPMIGCFEIIKQSEKAYQVKNNEDKTMWLPKKGLKNIDGLNDQYTIAPWFKRKLENWQVSFLQS